MPRGVLLKQPPVINEWQAPETLGDLIDAVIVNTLML